jgi:hypothetical protein
MLQMRRPLQVCAGIGAALLLIPSNSTAQDSGRVPAAECCQLLLVPVGAVSLGNALTAKGGADAWFVNPAGLATIEQDEFRIHSAPTVIETTSTFGVALRVRQAGTIGVIYQLIELGTIASTDKNQQQIGQIRFYDHILAGTFATSFGAGVTAGITYKLYQSRSSCSGYCEQGSAVATTHGIDFGVQYHSPLWRALQLGASITNAGLALQVVNAEQASPMPVRLRAGAAYEVMHHFAEDSTVAVWLNSDISVSSRQGVAPILSVGAEAVFDNTIFLRAGYASGSGRKNGAGVGVGLRYARFDISVATSFGDLVATETDPYQITFAITF